MQRKHMVLVVGTTSDYVDLIRYASGGQVFFLTDPETRRLAVEDTPSPQEEVLSDLKDFPRAYAVLAQALDIQGITISGVACFDCESFELSNYIAEQLQLPFPALASIHLCRDKYASKAAWQQHGVRCPQVRLVDRPAQVAELLRQLNGPCVMKPLSGTGSELTFRCRPGDDVDKIFALVADGMTERREHRLYCGLSADTPRIVAEECIEGTEYSADFLMEHGQASIIRITRKLPFRHGPFGTIFGYELCTTPPEGIAMDELRRCLLNGARALGLDNTICMVDFFIVRNEVVLLEMAPRPGGDCLPYLLKCASGWDIIHYTVDAANGRTMTPPAWNSHKPYVGLRVFALREGILRNIDYSALLSDPRVHEVYMIRKPGHHICLPPQDYGAWLMGHVIFEPDPLQDLADQCETLHSQIRFDIDPDPLVDLARSQTLLSQVHCDTEPV